DPFETTVRIVGRGAWRRPTSLASRPHQSGTGHGHGAATASIREYPRYAYIPRYVAPDYTTGEESAGGLEGPVRVASSLASLAHPVAYSVCRYTASKATLRDGGLRYLEQRPIVALLDRVAPRIPGRRG